MTRKTKAGGIYHSVHADTMDWSHLIWITPFHSNCFQYSPAHPRCMRALWLACPVPWLQSHPPGTDQRLAPWYDSELHVSSVEGPLQQTDGSVRVHYNWKQRTELETIILAGKYWLYALSKLTFHWHYSRHCNWDIFPCDKLEKTIPWSQIVGQNIPNSYYLFLPPILSVS